MTAGLGGSGFTGEHESFVREVARVTPSWLDTIRQCAFQRFQALGFPTTKNEDWHYTSVAPIAEAAYPPRTAPGGDVKAADLAPFTFGVPDWPTIVFVNGVFAPDLSSLGNLPEGVKVYDMASAFRSGDPLVERNLSKFAQYELNPFTALNSAFLSDGAVVRIAKEFEVDRPIHVLFVSDAMAAKTQANPRTLIVAERHSKATVIESYVSTSEASYFTNAVTEVLLEDGANLSHLKIQRESPRAFHVGTIEAEQKRDSHYQSFSFATGAILARTNIF
jgi:Fe-S cluster assembly protein SufD